MVVLAALSAPASANAQDMNIALSRLRLPQSSDPVGNPVAGCDPRARDFCPDNDGYRRVMTQFAGSMIPPILTPAGTRGVRGMYIGFETWLTGIDNSPDTEVGRAWFRAAEGDGVGGDTTQSRFVDGVLAWGRLNVRKGLPLGFELGTNVGYLANTSYWTLGLEVRWALWEGFREEIGWIPDVAVRAAVQTMMGDGEFNVTVPSLDLIISEPFVVANSVEITPSLMGQVAWTFVDSELVDLTPETSAFTTCRPDPRTPEAGFGSPPYCRGDGTELNHNVVFPRLRSTRVRIGAGLQVRYEWFALLGSFLFDAATPGELDGSLPADIPRQWQVDLGFGLTL